MTAGRDLDAELDALDRVSERLDAFERAYVELRDACQRRDAPAGIVAGFDDALAAGDIVVQVAGLRRRLVAEYDDNARERGES